MSSAIVRPRSIQPAASEPLVIAQRRSPALQLPVPIPYPHPANVWKEENRVSSGNEVRQAKLKDLPLMASGLEGIRWATVDGQTRLNGAFRYEPFVDAQACRRKGEGKGILPSTDEPTDETSGACVTSDGFDQAQLYSSLVGLVLYLGNLGINMEAIIGESRNGRLIAHANAVPDMNAWCSLQTEELTFGTSRDKWHLASDSDISIHESGHLIIHRIHPGLAGWYSREGGAIHEGTSDGLASLLHGDPEIGEDYPPAIGWPGNPNEGLRTVDNTMKLGEVSDEVHERGQVYGGFFWSLKKRLESKYNLKGRKASDRMILVFIGHLASYATSSPRPVDFVRAVLRGSEAIANVKKLGVPWARFREDIIDEAIKRGMIANASELEEAQPPKEIAAAESSWRKVGFTRGEVEERDIVESYRRLSPAIDFPDKPAESVTVLGVSRRDYPQMYRLQSRLGFIEPVTVRVVGAGFYIYYDARGQIRDVSSSDIKILKPGDIDETVDVTGAGAVMAVELKAMEERKTAVDAQVEFLKDALMKHAGIMKPPDRLDELEPLFLNRRDIPREAKLEYKKHQMQARIAEVAVERSKKLTRKDGELVVIPMTANDEVVYEKNLFYEFKMGLSLYYVNARTGEVKVKENVFWS